VANARKLYPQIDCRAKVINGNCLDELVWQDILGFIRNPKAALDRLQEKLLGSYDEQTSLVHRLDEEKAIAAKKERAAKNLVTMLGEELITREEFLERKAQYKETLAGCRDRIAQLEVLIGNQTQLQKNLAGAEALLLELQQGTDGEWTHARKRRLVELL